MEVNPYAAPQAPVEDRPFEGDLESLKATRGQRLGAAMLDGVILVVIMVTIMALGPGLQRSMSPLWIAGLALLSLLVTLLINGYFLHANGQTVGKKVLGIKIVRTDGSRASLVRIIGLRYLSINVLSMIPVVGRLASLVDCLMIFGQERRCLHDLFADTIVITADS